MVDDLFDVDREGAVVVRVWVQPGAKRAGLAGRHGDALRLTVCSRPERGRANADACNQLAELLGVQRRSVSLVGGATSRGKRLRVEGLGPAAARERLAALLASRHGEPGQAGIVE